MTRHSDTARGRVLPISRWIVLVLVGMVVLALSESALAETPGGSTTTAATQVRTYLVEKSLLYLVAGIVLLCEPDT